MRLGQRMTLDGARVEPSHPILELMVQRMEAGSTRGARTDGAVIALAIEGGGLGGCVSAGMCVMLEQLGLVDAVDVIYGTSAGALNGSFTAGGQAALACTDYLDVANTQFANMLRFFMRRPVVDFDMLFNDVIKNRKPYDWPAILAGPKFRALGVDLTTGKLTVMQDFADLDEFVAAVRVSCSLPLLSGPPQHFRGVPMGDGGLLESMPYEAARASEATHVLVLRSRAASYRKREYPWAMIEVVRRFGHPALAPLLRARPPLYNAEAEYLQAAGSDDPRLFQLAPPDGSPKVAQLERSHDMIRQGLTIGANVVSSALGLPSVDLHWQPEVYAVA